MSDSTFDGKMDNIRAFDFKMSAEERQVWFEADPDLPEQCPRCEAATPDWKSVRSHSDEELAAWVILCPECLEQVVRVK